MVAHPKPVPSAVLLGLVLAASLAGCGGSDDPPRAVRSTSAATPIERVRTQDVRLARVAFCPVVPSRAVRDALGGASQDATTWSNGERAKVDGQREDAVHEFGCSWTNERGTASAWIFARPISTDFARAVLAKTATRPGCRSGAGPGFGSPGQRQVCVLPGGERRVRVSGLFSDTWLTCQVSGPVSDSRASLVRRTNAWCVEILNATNTAR